MDLRFKALEEAQSMKRSTVDVKQAYYKQELEWQNLRVLPGLNHPHSSQCEFEAKVGLPAQAHVHRRRRQVLECHCLYQ